MDRERACHLCMRVCVCVCVCGARSLKDCREEMWQYMRTKFTIEPRQELGF